MPANHQHRPRGEKTAELVEIAQRLFVQKGYAGTTMAAIAAEGGVASNVVHWYFASKDELFVAALEALQSEGLEKLLEGPLEQAVPGEERKALESVLTKLVWHLLDMHLLIAAVHERSLHSEAVAAFHERAHRRYASYLSKAVERCDVPEAKHRLVVESLSIALDGLVLHHASKPKARRLISFLVEQLTSDPQGGNSR